MALGMVYFLPMILTELITNNAAAALMFPLALVVSNALGVRPNLYDRDHDCGFDRFRNAFW